MEVQDIVNFRKSIADMSVEDLEALLSDLNNQINRMILDSDLIMKVAIVNQAIDSKKGA